MDLGANGGLGLALAPIDSSLLLETERWRRLLDLGALGVPLAFFGEQVRFAKTRPGRSTTNSTCVGECFFFFFLRSTTCFPRVREQFSAISNKSYLGPQLRVSVGWVSLVTQCIHVSLDFVSGP